MDRVARNRHKWSVAMQTAWQSGEVREAQRINEIPAPLNRALFLETSPSPVKYAEILLGLSTPEVRLPLCEIKETTRSSVRDAMIGLVQTDSQTND